MADTDKLVYLPQLQRYDEKLKRWANDKFLAKADAAATDVRVNGKSITANGVADIPVAKDNVLGVVKSGTGTVVGSDGAMYTIPANKFLIDYRTQSDGYDISENNRDVITPSRLDYAVKAAMCDGKGAAWTNEEQAAAKERMGIGNYSLPKATTTTLGGVKVGNGLNVTDDGTLSVETHSSETLITTSITATYDNTGTWNAVCNDTYDVIVSWFDNYDRVFAFVNSGGNSLRPFPQVFVELLKVQERLIVSTPFTIQYVVPSNNPRVRTGMTTTALCQIYFNANGSIKFQMSYSGVDQYADATEFTNTVNEGVSMLALKDGGITGAKIKDNSIGSTKLKPSSVTRTNIADNAIEGNHIRDGQIKVNHIKDGAVTSAKLALGAVATENIKEGAITEAKINDGAITSAKLANGAVTVTKLASGAVNEDRLANGAVTATKIADGTITAAKLASNAVTTDKIADGAITADKLASGVGGGISISILTDIKQENSANGHIYIVHPDYPSVSFYLDVGYKKASDISNFIYGQIDAGDYIGLCIIGIGYSGESLRGYSSGGIYLCQTSTISKLNPTSIGLSGPGIKNKESSLFRFSSSIYLDEINIVPKYNFIPKSTSAQAALASLLPVQNECEEMEAKVAKLEQDWIDNSDETVAVDGNGVPITIATKKTELEKKKAELEKLREDYISKLGDWKNEVQE